MKPETDSTTMQNEAASIQRERLISINRLEIFLGCAVAVISIISAIGSWYVLPYRVAEAEKAISALKEELKSVRNDTNRQNELLIRIDERLSQVQRTLDERKAKP